MAQNGRNGTPAYKRIRGVIWKRIETGQLKPGDVVDSERELARIHQVSLMTARHALTSLEREGIVERRRGAGTFVAPPKIHFNKLMSYTEQMASRGLVACSHLLCIKLIEKEPEIAARLSVPPNSPLVKVERLRQAADEPFALEACYLSAEEFRRPGFRRPGTQFPVLHSRTRLRNRTRTRRRRSGCHRRGREDCGTLRRPARCSLAAHSSGHLFHQGESDHLCARLLPLRSTHFTYPQVPFSRIEA